MMMSRTETLKRTYVGTALLAGLVLPFTLLVQACSGDPQSVDAPPTPTAAPSSTSSAQHENSCSEKGPTIYGSGYSDIFADCGPLLAKPALETSLTVSSSKNLSVATREWFCSSASDQKAFSFASAASLVIPEAIPIPVDVKTSGSYSREKRQAACSEKTWKLDDFSTLNVLQRMVSNEENLKAYVECAKTASGKGGMKIDAAPEAPCSGQATVISLSFSAPAGAPTTSPRVSSVSASGLACDPVTLGTIIAPKLAIACKRTTNDVATLIVNTCEHGPFTLVLPPTTSCGEQACRTTLQNGSVIPQTGLNCDIVEIAAGATIKVMSTDPARAVPIKIGRVVVKGTAASPATATVTFDGRGAKGATGGAGSNCDHCIAHGRNWETDKKEAFEGARDECADGRATWNFGKPGAQGGSGGPGGTISLEIGNARDVVLSCQIGGGAGGDGGPGGLGRKLIHNTGGKPEYDCKVGTTGPAGASGSDGSCSLNGKNVGVQ